MSTDESPEDSPEGSSDDRGGVRDRLEQEAERATEEFDDGIVDLLSWVLDTETRARIYVYLRQHPASTSDEVADGTGLYPSTVRESLAELNDEGKVERRKRDSDGAGNNPYEYTAMAPSELVGSVVEDVQDELNTVFNLDCHLGVGDPDDDEPVTISVNDGTESAAADGTESDGEAPDDA
jgi:predicted transcriptional regulator